MYICTTCVYITYIIHTYIYVFMGFLGGTSGKESACQCRRHRRLKFKPWVRKVAWRRNGNPLQYSCLENPLFRRARWAAVHGVTKSQTRLSVHAWWNTRGITFSERNDLLFLPTVS